MNKQILVAGLLGAASAAAGDADGNCINPAVEKATQAHELALAAEAAEVAKTAALTEAEVAATAAWTPVAAALAPRDAARGALQAAQAAAEAASALRAGARATAASSQAGYTASELLAQQALDAAEALVGPAQTVIEDDQAVRDELAKAVADHAAQLLVLDAETARLRALSVAADGVHAAAVLDWNAKRVARAAVSGVAGTAYSATDGAAEAVAGAAAAANGSAKVLELAQADTASAKGAWEGAAPAAVTLFSAWQPKKAALAYAQTLKAAADLACLAVCQAQADSPVLLVKTAAGVAVAAGAGATAFDEDAAAATTFAGASTWRQAATTPWGMTAPDAGDTGSKGQAGRWAHWAGLAALEAGKWKLDQDEEAAIVTAAALVTAEDTAKGTAAGLLDGAVQAHAAELLLHGADAALLATADAGLATSKAAILPLNDDVVVKTYLRGLETALRAGAAADLLVYSADDAAAFLALKEAADTAVAGADAAMAQLQLELAPVAQAKDDAAADVAANTAAIAARRAELQGAAAGLAMAISVCKGNGYDRAQEALRVSLAKATADRVAAAAVATDYEAKAAFAAAGSLNFPCAMKDVDGTMTRPLCAEGQCCGAAQKFRRDGTKLTVETCQEEIGTHTYTYFPPLPAGATVEPAPETWRFQCISGAQKLVAATAAIAAAFAMA